MAPRSSAAGHATRGTTGTNRLRRIDRWIARRPELASAGDPLVVDLGFGASAVTTLELHERLARIRADVEVRGLEIDRTRVARATEQLATVRAGQASFASDARVSFGFGGFEVPLPHGRTATVIRAMNVLRQYDEDQVAGAWTQMASRLSPGGLLVEGTCDELGRVCTWVALNAAGVAQTLTVSLRLAGLAHPSIAAERLPKALIHRNVPGERVHDFFVALDRHWDAAAPLSAFGATQRWQRAVGTLREDGWPVRDPTRWRLGEVTVPWSAVAPGDPPLQMRGTAARA